MAHCWDMRKSGRAAWERWPGLIAEPGRTGQSMGALCWERGLCAPHFFASKKRLSQAGAGGFVEVQIAGGVMETAPAAEQRRAIGERYTNPKPDRAALSPAADLVHQVGVPVQEH